MVQRLGLPFQMLADPAMRLVSELRLPTFTAGGMTLYKRLTLIISGSVIEHVFYPVFPPGESMLSRFYPGSETRTTAPDLPGMPAVPWRHISGRLELSVTGQEFVNGG